jgi:heptosyltransferase III
VPRTSSPPAATTSTPVPRGDRRLRLLDRTVGVGILTAAGAVRRRRRRPEPVRRIGLMKSTGIGDMILLSGVVQDVAAAFPQAQTILFAGRDNRDVARLLGGVEVVALPMGEPWKAVRRLRSRHLDVLVDFGQWTRVEALCALFSGARYTLGFETPGQRRHCCYDETVLHSDDVHELENYRRLAARLGVESRSLPSLSPNGAAVEVPSGRFVVFHLWPGGYRSELKEWPLPSWRELARRLAERGYSILLTGSGADAARTEEFARSCDGVAGRIESVAGRYRLSELVDLLHRSSCVVSVNTGVMHLAAAAGAPTVALNGPTSEARWGPVGARAVSVNSELPGCGYLNLGFEYDGRRTDCMCGISVDRVADTVLALADDA